MDKGIWKLADLLRPVIMDEFRLSLGEGNTPLQAIDGIYFKREDKNPTGSVKDRGMTFQVSAWLQRASTPKVRHKIHNDLPIPGMVISSSGNAAISAAAYCNQARIKLIVFVSDKITGKKLDKLKKYDVKIIQSDLPISSAHRYAKKNGLYNLRPSKDMFGPVGYQTIGFELQEQLSENGSIWFPVSSGTTLLGVGSAFIFSREGASILLRNNVFPQFHAVQTSRVCPIAKNFDSAFSLSKSSLASALVARIVPRKKEIITLINQSGGSGWVVDDEQILVADKWLKDRGINTSFEGATALAGYFKAKESGFEIKEPVVIMLTGSL